MTARDLVSSFRAPAVAAAIPLFGLPSGAVLATVVGLLVEVPVMLTLVAFANRTRHWFPAEQCQKVIFSAFFDSAIFVNGVGLLALNKK